MQLTSITKTNLSTPLSPATRVTTQWLILCSELANINFITCTEVGGVMNVAYTKPHEN